MAKTIQEVKSEEELTHNPTAQDVAEVVNRLIAEEAEAKTKNAELKDLHQELVKDKGYNSRAIKTLMVLKKKAPEDVAHFLRELMLGVEGLNLNPQGDLFDSKTDTQQKNAVVSTLLPRRVPAGAH